MKYPKSFTTLHLPLTYHWWNMISTGKKWEEYRRNTQWLGDRLKNFYKAQDEKHYIIFQYGYTAKRLRAEVEGIHVEDYSGEFKPVIYFNGYKPQKILWLKEEWGFSPEVQIVFKLVPGSIKTEVQNVRT